MHFRKVILGASSVEKTKHFYHDLLELPVADESEDSVTFVAGDSLLSFTEVENAHPFYHIAFNVTNNKFYQGFEWIRNKMEILPVSPGNFIAYYVNWNAASFYFEDNNGSILEFIARYDLPYHDEGNFAATDIREVSEVGIVSHNVAETAEDLNNRYGIPYFATSKPTPSFTVLGDDYGLLIITQTGRGWVPNNKLAQIFPLTLISESGKIDF